jgi:hypothetical protein
MTGSSNSNSKGPKVRDEIDANLKRVYSDILNEEVPDRFRKLLDQLKRGTGETP